MTIDERLPLGVQKYYVDASCILLPRDGLCYFLSKIIYFTYTKQFLANGFESEKNKKYYIFELNQVYFQKGTNLHYYINCRLLKNAYFVQFLKIVYFFMKWFNFFMPNYYNYVISE